MSDRFVVLIPNVTHHTFNLWPLTWIRYVCYFHQQQNTIKTIFYFVSFKKRGMPYMSDTIITTQNLLIRQSFFRCRYGISRVYRCYLPVFVHFLPNFFFFWKKRIWWKGVFFEWFFAKAKTFTEYIRKAPHYFGKDCENSCIRIQLWTAWMARVCFILTWGAMKINRCRYGQSGYIAWRKPMQNTLTCSKLAG